MLGVGEAGAAPLGDRFAGREGEDRGTLPAAVLQDRLDRLDLREGVSGLDRRLGPVVGLEGEPVVLADVLGRVGSELERGDLLPEQRHVLAGQAPATRLSDFATNRHE
ncbi:MAG: hypothetical protein HP477_08780 [Nitrospira sp.]|nr:hypothetical protein [Nitrospira sp.]